MTIPLLSKLKKELDKLVQQIMLEPVNYPTKWCSPMVIVPKENINEIRFCCNFIKLNNTVKRAIHSVTKIEVSLSRLKGAKIFSTLYTNPRYQQINYYVYNRLRKEFIRLPFGVNCTLDYFS